MSAHREPLWLNGLATFPPSDHTIPGPLPPHPPFVPALAPRFSGRLGRILLHCAAISLAWGSSCGMVSGMNGRQMPNIVAAAPQRRQRRKRGIVPKGGRAPLSPRELELHAQLVADGRLKSGRAGGYDFYVVNGMQRWRRHAVPKDPRTPAQQRSRARFAAASKTWSEDGLLAEAHRAEWYADGAKRNSRPRLGSSGPLTGQQNYIGRNCSRNQRDSDLLLHPCQLEHEKVECKGLRPEITTELLQSQPFTRSTSDRPLSVSRVLPGKCRGSTISGRCVCHARPLCCGGTRPRGQPSAPEGQTDPKPPSRHHRATSGAPAGFPHASCKPVPSQPVQL